MGPKQPCSTVLSQEQEAVIVAFRKHTFLPLDDCLYALKATIPQLTRSAMSSVCKPPGEGESSSATRRKQARDRPE